jgi:hypothetical protein
VKLQTTTVKTKDKAIDTTGLPVEEVVASKEEDQNKGDELMTTQESVQSPDSSSGIKRKKPALFLDNLSSPSDSGSQKHASGSQNILSKTTDTSNGSGGSFNKKDLNYMLNRDPLKEFFHLTLQTIRMNSPHMNQILNVDGEPFYKKAQEMNVPFNQWGTWLEDQLNRIILSRILKNSMTQNMKAHNDVPNITVNKVIEDVDKMDSKRKWRLLFC